MRELPRNYVGVDDGESVYWIRKEFAQILTPERIKDELRQLLQPSNTTASVVGRGVTARINCGEIGEVLLRAGRRGGWLRFLNKKVFLRFPAELPRQFKEILILEHLLARSVNVPTAVGALVCGKWFYHGMVITRFLADTENLLQVVKQYHAGKVTAERLIELSKMAGNEAWRMVNAGVLHADLHLGNVLVSPAGVYLIDFDKAELISGLHAGCWDTLCRRWERSANKHTVSFMAEAFRTARDD